MALGTVNVDITAVNDVPTLTGLPATVTFAEDTQGNFDLSGATFFDPDGPGDATLNVTSIGSTQGTFTASSSGNVTVTGSGSAGLRLVGTAADIDTYLNVVSNIQYTPAADHNGSPADVISFTGYDSVSSLVGFGTVDINVTPVNDAPTGADRTVTIAEDGAHTFSVFSFGFSDVDTGDTLQAVRVDTIPATGTLQLSGVDVTAGQVIAAANLGNLVYAPPADANGSALASFTFSVQDTAGAFDAAPNTITVDVTAANDAPSGADKTMTTAEDTGHTFTTADFGFSVDWQRAGGGEDRDLAGGRDLEPPAR